MIEGCDCSIDILPALTDGDSGWLEQTNLL
ncbi:MAG: hypothetical protein ACI8S6_002185 [Myxococcota bacterium]|jgi:hypothetical protein